MCAHIGNNENVCGICIPLVDISPPMDIFVEKLRHNDSPMVPCDNLLLYFMEESLELISWHIQCSNMETSDAPGQGFHCLKVSNWHKHIGTHFGNVYHASH